jgi:peptide/nickel transport system ATP-binding protein
MNTQKPLLEIRDLVVEYRSRRRVVRAVDGVSLSVPPGETVGLVGESGSGKTTLGRAILGLAPVTSGTITFGGQDITRLRGAARRKLAREMQAVFQDPYSSLNPALTVSKIVGEALRAPGQVNSAEAATRVRDMLERVGLSSSAGGKFPGSFSGGQRQRIAIARALISSPRLVICDEAVSALDLSIQAQILNLLRGLQRETALSYLFIGHDLDVVRYMAERTVVMYRGRVMEEGPADAVARRPGHPYTRALVASMPSHDPRMRKTARTALADDVTAALAPPPPHGCPFAPRCPEAIGLCREQPPPPVPTADGGLVACHRYPELAARPGAPVVPPVSTELVSEVPAQSPTLEGATMPGLPTSPE